MTTSKNSSVSHTWKVERLIQLNNDIKLISKVVFSIKSQDGEFFSIRKGEVLLDTENIENFIPYGQLDEETIIGWVKSKLGETASEMELNNLSFIEEQKNPPKTETIVESLPWNQPQPVVEEPVV